MSALLSAPLFELATRTAAGWLERRMHAAPEIAARANSSGEIHLTGYGARFGMWSSDLGGFIEQIAPGAFANAARTDVRALFNHNADLILGRTTAGTLRVWQDSVGLNVDIRPPSTAIARHVVEAVRRRDVTGMSFGFIVVADRVESGDPIRRTLLEGCTTTLRQPSTIRCALPSATPACCTRRGASSAGWTARAAGCSRPAPRAASISTLSSARSELVDERADGSKRSTG